MLVALQNAFYRLLHADSLNEGVVATVRSGADADTNGAICGALLGAVHGRDALPAQWRRMIITCRPMPGYPDIRQAPPGHLLANRQPGPGRATDRARLNPTAD